MTKIASDANIPAMWLAFVSIAASILLALLGFVVGAHPEFTRRHLRLIDSLFVLFALVSVASSWLQAHDSAAQAHNAAVANAKLSESVDKLGKVTDKASGLTALNAKLQQQVLNQSEAIRSLSQMSLNDITGGNSYPEIIPQPTAPGAPIKLGLWDEGKYLLNGVTVTVSDLNHYFTDPREFTIGAVHPGWPRFLPFFLTPKLNKNGVAKYEFDIYTQSALFSEMLGIRKGTNGSWNYEFWGEKVLFNDDARRYMKEHHLGGRKIPKGDSVSFDVSLFNHPWSGQPTARAKPAPKK